MLLMDLALMNYNNPCNFEILQRLFTLNVKWNKLAQQFDTNVSPAFPP